MPNFFPFLPSLGTDRLMALPQGSERANHTRGHTGGHAWPSSVKPSVRFPPWPMCSAFCCSELWESLQRRQTQGQRASLSTPFFLESRKEMKLGTRPVILRQGHLCGGSRQPQGEGAEGEMKRDKQTRAVTSLPRCYTTSGEVSSYF